MPPLRGRTYAALTFSPLVSYLLFADDNEDMRLMVQAVLEASGHEVGLVPDGSAALDAMREREPDLLILDLAMPRVSGFEVCRAVKANPFTARVPVLLLTARSEIESKVAGFEAGADDYLAKPFDPRELRARVEALLRLVRREADRNPTSGLPGGRAIEDEIQRRVRAGEAFAVCYFDIDYFKAFADTFGFAAADQVIRGTATSMRDLVAMFGGPDDFVGHIGGDDFLIVTSPHHAETIAREAGRRFAATIGEAVDAEAAARGWYEGVDREGVPRRFPLAGISCVVLTTAPGRWRSMIHLGSLAADAKRRAKQTGTGLVVEAV
jgi:PleD family two-component response regulator